MSPNITIAYGDDWEAIYINDEKVAEGHSVPTTTILAALGYEVTEISCDKQLNTLGHAPAFASEIIPDL